MKNLFLLISLLAAPPLFSQNVAGYTLKDIAGRKVYVERTALTNHAEVTKEALDLLRSQLQTIDKLNMKASAKAFLKTVPFFLDWRKRSNGGAEYHPSRQWLLDNGFKPEKAKSVNITNISNFVSWTKLNQPYVVLHELTHAYHDQKLGYSNQDIKDAYTAAMNSKKYESVDYFDGKKTFKKKAYATNNEQEYFAELTEAYFGKNDFYPFNKEELGQHDSQMYDVIRKVWQGYTYDPAQIKFDPNKYYRLTTKWQGKGKSLDVINDGKNNKLQLANSGNFTGQKWRIVPTGDGYFRLTTKWQGEGKSLDVINDGKNNKLQLAKTGNFTGQKWRIEPVDKGFFRLSTKWQGPGKSLDVVNSGKKNKLQLAKSGNFTGQKWSIQEVN